MKILLIIALAISITWHLSTIYRYSPPVQDVYGGGQSLASPNGKYIIRASSLMDANEETSDGSAFAEITLSHNRIVNGHNIDGDVIKKFHFTPINGSAGGPPYRGGHKIIKWSDDSKSATVDTAEYQLKIYVEQES